MFKLDWNYKTRVRDTDFEGLDFVGRHALREVHWLRLGGKEMGAGGFGVEVVFM